MTEEPPQQPLQQPPSPHPFSDSPPNLPAPQGPTQGPLPAVPDRVANPRRNRYGRTGALTPEVQEKIVEAVEVGNYLKTAAQYAGIGQTTLSSWLARGRAAAAEVAAHEDDPEWQLPEADQRYLNFLEEVTRAETAAEVEAVRAWRSAFDDDWRAARDYLARKRPEQWAGVTRVQMTTEETERRLDDAVNETLLALREVVPGLDLGDLDGDADDDLDPDLEDE